jgi:hypothetical protein
MLYGTPLAKMKRTNFRLVVVVTEFVATMSFRVARRFFCNRLEREDRGAVNLYIKPAADSISAPCWMPRLSLNGRVTLPDDHMIVGASNPGRPAYFSL